MVDEKFKLKGILTNMDITTGEGTKGKWSRAALKIEKEGKLITVSTFDETDQATALKSNGKAVELIYTKSIKGEQEYKNMVKGTLKVIDTDSLNEIKEETVEDGITEESVEDEPKSTVQNNNPKAKKDYWEKKFDYEVEKDPIVQQRIIRQNAWTQANKYIENLISADSVNVEKKDLTLKSVMELAHKIEEDIMRK